jgi:DMSO reductase anchor subunit
VNTTTLSWTIALFFGGSIVFAAIRRLTDDAGWGVTLLAQLGALALIVVVIVLVVRRNSRDERE